MSTTQSVGMKIGTITARLIGVLLLFATALAWFNTALAFTPEKAAYAVVFTGLSAFVLGAALLVSRVREWAASERSA